MKPSQISKFCFTEWKQQAEQFQLKLNFSWKTFLTPRLLLSFSSTNSAAVASWRNCPGHMDMDCSRVGVLVSNEKELRLRPSRSRSFRVSVVARDRKSVKVLQSLGHFVWTHVVNRMSWSLKNRKEVNGGERYVYFFTSLNTSVEQVKFLEMLVLVV